MWSPACTQQGARSASAAVAATVVLAAAVAWGAPDAARALHDLESPRTAGADRIRTAAAVAREAHPEGASRAVIAHAGGFADALAAAPLTRTPDGPLLLTHHDALPEATRQALADLGVDEVAIVGGTEAVSEVVAGELAEAVGSVTRVAGPNRFGTAVAVADVIESGADRSVGDLNHSRTAFLVNAWRFADAMAASAAAASAADPFPILLTEPDRLPAATERALADLDIHRVIIVGGTGAVSAEVAEQVRGDPRTIVTQRLAGPNRMATSSAVAEFTRRQLTGRSEVLLARGDGFADALAAGTLGGLRQDPVLLTAGPDRLGEPAAQWVAGECPGLDAVRAVGGPGAVSAGVMDAAADCHEGRTQVDYSVAPLEFVRGEPGDALWQDVALGTEPKFTGSVTITLFPCGAVDHGSEPALRFADEDGDGAADGLGGSDSGHATIASLDGQPTDARVLTDVGSPETTLLEYTVASDAPDCTATLVFADANDDGQLQVDAQGLPLEFYGWGHLSWRRD